MRARKRNGKRRITEPCGTTPMTASPEQPPTSTTAPATTMTMSPSVEFYWTREHSMHLLDLVRDRPLLWDHTHPDYLKKKSRGIEFAKVARKLTQIYPQLEGLDGECTRKKFNNMKSYLRRLHKDQFNISDFEKNSVKWNLFEHASYMLNSLAMPTHYPETNQIQQLNNQMQQNWNNMPAKVKEEPGPYQEEEEAYYEHEPQCELLPEENNGVTEECQPGTLPLPSDVEYLSTDDSPPVSPSHSSAPSETSAEIWTPTQRQPTKKAKKRRGRPPKDNSKLDSAIASVSSVLSNRQSKSFGRGLGMMVEEAVNKVPVNKRCKLAVQIIQLIDKACDDYSDSMPCETKVKRSKRLRNKNYNEIDIEENEKEMQENENGVQENDDEIQENEDELKENEDVNQENEDESQDNEDEIQENDDETRENDIENQENENESAEEEEEADDDDC